MSEAKTYLLQLWYDERGLWAVLKAPSGRLWQFESLEALVTFMREQGPQLAPSPEEFVQPSVLN